MRWLILLTLIASSLLFSGEALKYIHLEIPQSIHIIQVDPSFYEIKPAKAFNKGIRRESVLSISKRHAAIAAVNGGFFAIGGILDGLSRGTLKIHDWYALPWKPRGCIGWSGKDLTPKMDRLLVTMEANYEEIQISINGLNRARKEGEIILFHPCFNQSTLTSPDGEEIIVIRGIIENIVKGGNSKIPENGYVLSLSSNHPLSGTFEIGKHLSFSTQVIPQIEESYFEDWNSFDYIVGGSPLLLYQGYKITDFKPEETISTFLTHKHARTAIGILPNGNWVFVVIDKTNVFDGMTIDELRDFMANLGCLCALNLDGGSSSTMVYEGFIKNISYDDKNEFFFTRLVSDAILILPKIL